jgi:hypothetical protein
MVFGQTLLLGDNLLPLLTLALGGALVVGNAAALIRPPATPRDADNLERPPLIRTVVFILFGLVMTVWALASLL